MTISNLCNCYRKSISWHRDGLHSKSYHRGKLPHETATCALCEIISISFSSHDHTVSTRRHTFFELIPIVILKNRNFSIAITIAPIVVLNPMPFRFSKHFLLPYAWLGVFSDGRVCQRGFG